jgi:hypothetical protein
MPDETGPDPSPVHAYGEISGAGSVLKTGNLRGILNGASKPHTGDLLADRLIELRESLEGRDPQILARNTASEFLPLIDKKGLFRLSIWELPVEIAFPEMVCFGTATTQPVPEFQQALMLYYFTTCDGTPASGQWISFSELPDGRFYNQAFQGYTGRPLGVTFGDDLPAFSRCSEKLGGVRAGSFGDQAYAFHVLPLVSILAVAWMGDEDFPAAYQILFDANASHHLPTDACAILGSTLTRRLIKSREQCP